MQTRKKSISLHALGVIPSAPRGSAAHRSNSSSTTPSTANASSSDAHPAKRMKRSHTVSTDTSSASISTSPSSPPPRRRNPSASIDKGRHFPIPQATPPPSPDDFQLGKIDAAGINDDIVVGVLRQLEVTGNRPHQIKELATALSGNLRSVDSSSNPVAIISSRLTNYLRRPWTAIAPCPLAKEQVNIHPRRVYYYLTTCPRQQIPDYASAAKSPVRIISPSLSSGPEEDEDQTADRKREALSPSPELDFELPNLDMDSMSGLTYGDSSQQHSLHGSYMSAGRAASPPLEHDEREFTQTATSMACRAQTSAAPSPQSQIKEEEEGSPAPLVSGSGVAVDSPDEMVDDAEYESEELRALRNQEVATALFGHGNGGARLGIGGSSAPAFGSSPMLRPMTGSALKDGYFKSPSTKRFDDLTVGTNFGGEFGAWGELKSPEAVGLNELDDMLGGF